MQWGGLPRVSDVSRHHKGGEPKTVFKPSKEDKRPAQPLCKRSSMSWNLLHLTIQDPSIRAILTPTECSGRRQTFVLGSEGLKEPASAQSLATICLRA